MFSRTDSKPDTPEDVLKMYSEVNNSDTASDNRSDSVENEKVDKTKPTKKKRYPKLGNYNEFSNYEKPGWPGKDECVTHVTRFPEWTQLPTVYLSPGNKGYDLRRMINHDIDLTPTKPHPLPWYPPLCDVEKFNSLKLPSRFSNLPGFITSMNKDKYPDESIKLMFLHGFGKNDMSENIAELGARIKTVQDGGQWPSWLINILSATYWRIVGNTGNSFTCYGLALSEVPTQYLDLVLTNLGGLLYKLGHVDQALRLLQEAVAVCDTEPETHFFLATLLAAKGNMTGSIEHYRATLRLEPDYQGGVDQLRIPSCYVKYHLGGGGGPSAPNLGESLHCRAPGFGGPGCDGRDLKDSQVRMMTMTLII